MTGVKLRGCGAGGSCWESRSERAQEAVALPILVASSAAPAEMKWLLAPWQGMSSVCPRSHFGGALCETAALCSIKRKLLWRFAVA